MSSQNKIIVTMPDDPYSGLKRIAQHESFIIGADLEMGQVVRVRTLSQDGESIMDKIMTDDSLTDVQKTQRASQYGDIAIQRTTQGAFANAQTGAVCEEDEPGAVSQKVFFQSITIGALKAKGMAIDDSTSVASLLYTLIQQEIVNIRDRGDL